MTRLSYDDAVQMYHECIVEVADKLLYVRDVSRDKDNHPTLHCREILTQKSVIVLADPDLVHCPCGEYRLGYIQDGDNAVYLSRTPRRQYRVGWCVNNVNNLNPERQTRRGESLVNNLKGVFMSYKDAFDRSKMTSGLFAFDRMFAIGNRGTHLHYKGTAIAIIDETTGIADLARHNASHLESLYNAAMERG